MERKTETIYEWIMLLANEMDQQGIRPTISKIKAKVGREVSQAQVAKYLRIWKKEKAEIDKPVKWVNSQELHDDKQTDESDSEGNVSVAVKKQTAQLTQSLALVRATLEATIDGILIISKEGKLVDWNKKLIEIMHVPEQVLMSRDEEGGVAMLLEQVADPQSLMNDIMYCMQNPEASVNLGEMLCKDGRIIERYSQPHIVDGEIVGRVWSFRDITERKQTELELLLKNRAMEASPNGIFILDAINNNLPMQYVNPAFENMTGYASSEVLGEKCIFLQNKYDKDPQSHKLEEIIHQKETNKVEMKCYKFDGTSYWGEIHIAPVPDPNGDIRYFVGIVVDITDRVKLRKQLEHQVTHDSLTSLPNRALLWDRLHQATLHAKRNKRIVAVLFIDLDRFKLINDSLGHLLGDKLLEEVANRLLATAREYDTVSRLGGDEFVIVLAGIEQEEDAVNCAMRVLEEVSKPYQIQGHTLNTTASIGICFYPKDGKTVETLLKHADLSMYRAKEKGRNNFKFYTSGSNKAVNRLLKIENNLRTALQNHEFKLVYQPIIEIKTGKVIGCESLIRWHNPELGQVRPDEFIPIAEENRIIGKIGEWVLARSCKTITSLEEIGIQNFNMAVNLSAREFKQKGLIDLISKILRKYSIDPKQIHLEITERVVMEDIEYVIDILNKLKDLGVHIELDDFGTEYSSLSYLIRLPIDAIKIDLSFTRALYAKAENESLVKSIIALGKSLGIRIIAEGIENQKQYNFYKENKCDFGQGYLMSKPLSYDELIEFLKAQRI